MPHVSKVTGYMGLFSFIRLSRMRVFDKKGGTKTVR